MSPSQNASHLSIVARPEGGFRRAGYKFSADQPTLIPVADLTDEQIVLLKAEKNLIVLETNGEAPVSTPVRDKALEEAVQIAVAAKEKAEHLAEDLSKEIKTIKTAHEAEIKGLASQIATIEDDRTTLSNELKTMTEERDSALQALKAAEKPPKK